MNTLLVLLHRRCYDSHVNLGLKRYSFLGRFSMTLLFRMLGAVTFLYLVVFGGYIAIVESLALMQVSAASSNDLLITFFRIWLLPFGGIALAVVCFGVAEAFAQVQAVRYIMRYSKQRRTAQNVNYHIHVPDDDRLPPRGVRTLPGRNVPMREIPLPEQRRRNWVLPGRPHEEARIRSVEHDPNQRYKPKP